MADNIYLNIDVPNTITLDDSFLPPNRQATYDVTLSNPVLTKPADYYLSILRFQVPLDTIPIFSFPLNIWQNNPNLSLLLIGIQVSGGTQYSNFVEYVSTNNLPVPVANPSPPANVPYFTEVDVTNPYYFVYNIQPMINMINTALALGVTQSGIGVTAPYYIYNPITQLISLVVTQTFINTGAQIFMNSPLKTYLNSFYYTSLNDINTGAYLFYQNLATTPFGQTGPTFTYSEEYNSIALWFDIRKIVVQSTSIPVKFEASPTVTLPQFTTNINGTANTIPIITDYAVSYDNINDISTVATYNPTAQYRLSDMNGGNTLNRINLSFYWLSKNGYRYPIFISPNQTTSIKIAFFHRSLYKKLNY